MKVVVFDLDGTLVDSFEDIARAANHALAAKGIRILPTAEIKKHVGCGLEKLLRELIPNPDEAILQETMTMVTRYYEAHPADFSYVYPGIAEMLENLGNLGYYRAILSNKAHAIVVRILEALGLSELVESGWGHQAGYPLKPDPTSLLEILRQACVSPAECVVVGDSHPDRELARRSRTQFCAVTWGMTPREKWELGDGDWLIERPEELIRRFAEPSPRTEIPYPT